MATSRLRLVPCEQPDRWNAIVRSVPGGTGYHEWSFLDLQERLSGVRFVRLLVVRGDRPVGALPVARTPGRPWRTPSIPFPFLGPVVPPELLAATLSAMRRWQWRHGLVLHGFDLAPRLTAATNPSGLDRALRARHDGTVVIDLDGRSASELDSAVSRLRRRSMVKAERAGCSARAAAPGETAAILGQVLTGTYGRRGCPSPYPSDIGEVVERWAAGRDDVHLVSAFVGERLVGSLVVLGWHPVALAWIGGVLPEFHDTRTGDLMHRELIHWAAARGNTALDMSGRVDDAIERYKLSLGGEVVPYDAVTSSLLPHPAFLAARGLSRFARVVRTRSVRAERTGSRALGGRALVDAGMIGMALLATVSSALAEIGRP